MDWKHGYFAESGYTHGHYLETMPSRLRWAALLHGHRAPRAGFRYLDAGCGQGDNLVLAALCHPDSEFVGLDFLPEHIAHGRDLAARCGLRNVRFIEGDFLSLAGEAQALGEFDFAVCHGISTWIAPAVREALFRLVGQVLKPGGLFYNSYNTWPGWLATAPLQHLVLLMQRHQRGDQALASAQALLARMREPSAGGLFKALPGLEKRLDSMARQDPAYLVQEYNNQHWAPVYASQMIEALAAVKLGFLGTATLADAFDAVLPPSMREILAGQPDAAQRETVRDLLLVQSFRRDLYVKGRQAPWPAERDALLADSRWARLPTTLRPASGQPFMISGTLELKGEPETYGAVLDAVEAAGTPGITTAELRERLPEPMRGALVQTLTLLLHGQWIVRVDDPAPRKVRDATQAMAAAATLGAPLGFAALPRAGHGLSMRDVDWMFLDAELQGCPSEDWPARVAAALARLGRTVALPDGQPAAYGAPLAGALKGPAERFEVEKLPVLRAFGSV